MNKILGLICLLILMGACDPGPASYNYSRGSLPTTPISLEDFNTEYDDYNATAPTFGYLIPFCFSTNRQSGGGEFDVLYQPMNVNFDRTTGVLHVTNTYANWGVLSTVYEMINDGVAKVNSSSNEFGPYLVHKQDFDKHLFTLLYATDLSGDFQIYFTSNHHDPKFSGVMPVDFLNSEFDDLYPSINPLSNRIYFCSNRDAGKFDIYHTSIHDPNNDLSIILSDSSYHEIIKEAVISGPSNDKCPYLFDKFLIFASDRNGGFGGYDLYYSKMNYVGWSEPVNFGPDINSEFDEYRPILVNEGVSEVQTMMIFSSNKAGGKGGFDLYFLGVNLEQLPEVN